MTRRLAAKSAPSNVGRNLPQRGRPSTERSSAIHKSVIAAATEIFLQFGYEQMTMDAVAARSGVTKATLYNRFGDKRSLMQATLTMQVAHWNALAARRNSSLADNLTERLIHYTKSMIIWGSKPEVQKFTQLAVTLASDGKRPLRRMDRFGYAEMLELISSDIRKFGPAMGINARDPERIADVFTSMVTGWIGQITPMTTVSTRQAREAAEFIVDLLLNGKGAW